MNLSSEKPTDINSYIADFPAEVRALLQKMRETIQAAAPEAIEKLSYSIPTFHLHGNLVHFAAFQKHVGFYPGSEAIAKFADELKDFHTSKGTVQFPFNQPIPFKVVSKIVKFRVKVVLEEKKEKDAKKKK